VRTKPNFKEREKKMRGKRLVSFFTVLIVLLASSGMVFAGGSQPSGSAATGSGLQLKPVKIAVAFWQIDANALLIQKYLKEYVGPAFNTEFIFSEAIADSTALMTFMENAYASGCQGIMNYQNTAVEQAIAKANELGLFISANTQSEAKNDNLPYFTGFVTATAEGVAISFDELVKELFTDGKPHNVIIVSAGAGLGNREQYESTMSILKTLESVYGLKYEKTKETLAVARSETDAVNDKGIKITIYPGFPTGDTYVTGASALLQTGDYDTVLACNAAFARFTVAIDEVEKAYKNNIRVSAITAINDQTKKLFNTTDSTGHPSLDSAMLMPSVSTAAGMFALVYNGITGNAETVRVNGKGIYYNSPKWKCHSPAEYTRIEKINTSNDTWEINIDELRNMLIVTNPQATSDSIFKQLEGATADYILKARGL
jgi:hypothetical protein